MSGIAHEHYDAARALNARIIYCSVLAYGETGPLRTLPGYDPLMQAHGGIMSITGEPDGAPSRPRTCARRAPGAGFGAQEL